MLVLYHTLLGLLYCYISFGVVMAFDVEQDLQDTSLQGWTKPIISWKVRAEIHAITEWRIKYKLERNYQLVRLYSAFIYIYALRFESGFFFT